MKIIVIGMSLSGKTTIVKHLRSATKVPVLEIDEELTRLNNGIYPADNIYKIEKLAPRVMSSILKRNNIIFFTNTNYFSISDLEKAHKNGFTIIQLDLSVSEATKRNQNRVKKEGYSDLSKWFGGMQEYQEQIKIAGVVDKVIDATISVEEIAEQILVL